MRSHLQVLLSRDSDLAFGSRAILIICGRQRKSHIRVKGAGALCVYCPKRRPRVTSLMVQLFLCYILLSPRASYNHSVPRHYPLIRPTFRRRVDYNCSRISGQPNKVSPRHHKTRTRIMKCWHITRRQEMSPNPSSHLLSSSP